MGSDNAKSWHDEQAKGQSQGDHPTGPAELIEEYRLENGEAVLCPGADEHSDPGSNHYHVTVKEPSSCIIGHRSNLIPFLKLEMFVYLDVPIILIAFSFTDIFIYTLNRIHFFSH
jgi:hypothetical protein